MTEITQNILDAYLYAYREMRSDTPGRHRESHIAGLQAAFEAAPAPDTATCYRPPTDNTRALLDGGLKRAFSYGAEWACSNILIAENDFDREMAARSFIDSFYEPHREPVSDDPISDPVGSDPDASGLVNVQHSHAYIVATIGQCFARAEMPEEYSPNTLRKAAFLIGDLANRLALARDEIANDRDDLVRTHDALSEMFLRYDALLARHNRDSTVVPEGIEPEVWEAIRTNSSPAGTAPLGSVHGGQDGVIIWERHGKPHIVSEIMRIIRREVERATLTPPTDPKTPDAATGGSVGAGGLREAVIAAVRKMPRTTPAPGGASTFHPYQIEAGRVWELDRALLALDALAQPAPVGEDETGVREALDGIDVHEQAGNYTFRSDTDYNPSDFEKELLEDFGLDLVEKLYAAIAAHPRKAGPAEGSGPDVANHFRLRAERAEQFVKDMRKARNYSDGRRDYWINEAQRLAQVVRDLGGDPEAATQLSKAKTPAIPTGVYYNDGNFYDVNTSQGLGNEFYATWRQRHSEFPNSPTVHPPAALSTAPAARPGDGVERALRMARQSVANSVESYRPWAEKIAGRVNPWQATLDAVDTALAQPAPVGEHETGVREAAKALERMKARPPESDEAWAARLAPQLVASAIEDDAHTFGSAPQPPKAETPAGVEPFPVGTPVERTTGEYDFPGTVVATFDKLAGQRRYVVEDDRRSLHIFRAANLRVRGRAEPVASGLKQATGWYDIARDEARMVAWVTDRFGAASLENSLERVDRLLEEVVEMQQAVYAKHRPVADGHVKANRIVAHVYGKEPGEPAQEMGGVMTCALALAANLGVPLDWAAKAEITRIEALSKDHFDKRHQAKVDAGVAAQHDRPEE